VAAKPITQTAFRRAIQTLRKHIEYVEALGRENRDALEVQFKRIASIQAELDQLQAALRRSR
jgi:hypothetical protein